VISDLFGASGLRILGALAEGQTDPQQLAELGSDLLRCTQAQLIDALTGKPEALHLNLLGLHLDRLQLIDQQMEKLNRKIAAAMQAHEDAVVRLAEIPGFGVDSAQQVIAEVGVQASTFASAGQLSSWAGTCPGKQESAEQNQNPRSAKGNKYLRRVLTEVAQAAVKARGSHFQIVFRRLLPRLGYKQALWAVVHRLCRLVWKILHDGVRYVERSAQRDLKAAKKRAQLLVRSLRKLGYHVNLTPIIPTAAQG
jgi:transposase